MYIAPRISVLRNFKKTYKSLILILAYTGIIFYFYKFQHAEKIDIPMSISTVLGFAVSLLLGFRTNEAYDRWWEARKIWGAIVNDSRTFTRQLVGFIGYDSEKQLIREIAYTQLAWNYALKSALRKIPMEEEIKPLLTAEDFEYVTKQDNVPNAILHQLETKIRSLKTNSLVTNYEFVELDSTLKNFCDHMGKCERINNTVFPAHYRYFTYVGILVYILMLPFGMLESLGAFMIPIVTIVFFFFITLEKIAYTLQDPFKNRGSDTPMLSLCRTIEINVKQMLGDSNLPEKLKPNERGALM